VLLPTVPAQPAAPIILWHPRHGSSEFFILECRQPHHSGPQYDGSLPGDGALIWHVTRGASTQASHLGAPNLARGGNSVWTAGMTTPPLRWNDGSPVGISLTFEHGGPSSNSRMRVGW
jgi:hypothetical protein